MHKTYQPPTTSPAGPPHDHTHPRHSCTHPRHDHTHPRHSCTHPRHDRPRLRHSREGGNPPRCIHTPKETTLLPPSTNSTKPDRILQGSTETRARTRTRGNRRSVSFLSAWIVPRSQRIRCTAWSCRPIAAMPINQTEPGFVLRTCDVKRGKGDVNNLHGGHLLYYPGYGTIQNHEEIRPIAHISPLRIDGLGA